MASRQRSHAGLSIMLTLARKHGTHAETKWNPYLTQQDTHRWTITA